jgi:hypothetical protein
MRRIAIVAAVLAVGGLSAEAQNIGGRYRIEGTNPNGSRYAGTAVVTLTSDTTCRIVWDTGGTSNGICMRNGDTFAAGYVLQGKPGLVIYRLSGDGSMRGIWTIAGEGGAGTENLYPLR